MRNLTAFACSASSIERLRAHWVTRLATGLAVIPAIRTRRVAQDHDLDREIRISADDESDELEDAEERPVEE